jgi:hypothetical protein
MGVPNSEVGYTSAMPRREDHEVHKGHVVALEKKRPLTCFSVMIPDALLYNFDLLMMNTLCSKHVEEYNKLIIKQEFVQ